MSWLQCNVFQGVNLVGKQKNEALFEGEGNDEVCDGGVSGTGGVKNSSVEVVEDSPQSQVLVSDDQTATAAGNLGYQMAPALSCLGSAWLSQTHRRH